MKTAKFQYKCRLCGEVEENPETAEKNAVLCLLDAIDGTDHYKMMGFKPQLLSSHTCKDGSHGVSDLIGYKLYD